MIEFKKLDRMDLVERDCDICNQDYSMSYTKIEYKDLLDKEKLSTVREFIIGTPNMYYMVRLTNKKGL